MDSDSSVEHEWKASEFDENRISLDYNTDKYDRRVYHTPNNIKILNEI
jgi:hypothetical protein